MRALRPLLVLCFTIRLLPAADDLQPVYAKIDAGAAGFKGLTADIHRVDHVDLIHEDDIESGNIVLKRSKPHEIRMRINILDPAKQVFFSGNKLLVYYPKSNSAEEHDLGKYKNMVEQFLLLGFGSTSKDLREGYNVQLTGQENISNQPTWHIELTPKSSDVSQTFPKIELWISTSTGMAMQQKLFEKGGKDYHLITYSNMKLRSDIPDSDLKPNMHGAVVTKPLIK